MISENEYKYQIMHHVGMVPEKAMEAYWIAKESEENTGCKVNMDELISDVIEFIHRAFVEYSKFNWNWD